MMFAICYQQYQFSVFQDMRHMIVPPYTPKKLWDMEQYQSRVRLKAETKIQPALKSL